MGDPDLSVELLELIQQQCLLDYDGCVCALPRGHGEEVLHRCPSEGCEREWTTEMAVEWWRDFRERYRVAPPPVCGPGV